MGLFCSCLRGKSSSSSSGQETELTNKRKKKSSSNADGSDKATTLHISPEMSSPSIQIASKGMKVSGNGMALVNVSIEQDAAYWEWHIEMSSASTDNNEGKKGMNGGMGRMGEDDEENESNAMMFGVATKKNKAFYRNLKSHEDEDAISDDGTALMRPMTGLEHGDTVGIAVQQSDLPMVQFLLNGEPLHELAINRFRGAVYPSIRLREGITALLVCEEDDFKELSPHARFGPLIAARGII